MRQLRITNQITQRNEESINRYFIDINKYSLVSVEEEVELSIKIRNGDINALERLVVANLRFVISVAKQYQNQGLSFPDLINEGNIGLVKAARKFDETRGFKFISYAVWWIRQSIIQAISEQTRIVHLPLNRLSTIHKITHAIPYLEKELEREPTDDEIASYLDITVDDVRTANVIKMRHVSFDKPISNDGESDRSLYDVIQTGNTLSTDNSLMKESVAINIKRALSKLAPRESAILTMSFGLENTPVYSLYDIALKFNITSERVRQIKARGLAKLKTYIKRNSNNTFLDN